MSGHLALPCEAEGPVPDAWGVSVALLFGRLTRSSSALLILLPIRTGDWSLLPIRHGRDRPMDYLVLPPVPAPRQRLGWKRRNYPR
jgi:hypothetical protein